MKEQMNFCQEDADAIEKGLRDVTFVLALFSERDETEDARSQEIRKKLEEYRDKAFDLREDVEFILKFYGFEV